MSDNEDIKTTWISRYSLKFEGCRNWQQQGGGEDGDDKGSPYVQYRLCPTGSDRGCTTGCQGGNSFVVSMNHFIESYVESRESTCRKERENCPCDANEKHEVKKCLKKCMEEKDLHFCIQNEHKIDPKTFATCTELRPTRRNNIKNRNRNKVENEWEENKEDEKEEPDNDGNHLFVGPYCSGDGIYLRTFVDKDCTKVAKRGAYERLNRGASLPYSNEPLVGGECMTCDTMYDPKERALKDGVAPTCSKLYDISDKWTGAFLEGIDEPADETQATPCGNRRGCNDQDTSEETEPEPEPEEEEETEESELGSSGTESAEDPDKENESEESEGPEETSCRGSDCDDPGPDEPVTPEDPDQPEEPDEPCQGSDCEDPGSDQPETPEDPTTDPERPEPEFPVVPVPPCQGRNCHEELPCRLDPGCTLVLPVPVPEPCHGNPDGCPQPVPPGEPVAPPPEPCDPRGGNDCDIPEAPVDQVPEPGVPADPPVAPEDGDLFPEGGGGDRALLLGGAGSWRARESHPGAGSNPYTSASTLVVLLVVAAAVALLARRVYDRSDVATRGDRSKKEKGADSYNGEAELEDGLVVVAGGMTTDD